MTDFSPPTRIAAAAQRVVRLATDAGCAHAALIYEGMLEDGPCVLAAIAVPRALRDALLDDPLPSDTHAIELAPGTPLADHGARATLVVAASDRDRVNNNGLRAAAAALLATGFAAEFSERQADLMAFHARHRGYPARPEAWHQPGAGDMLRPLAAAARGDAAPLAHRERSAPRRNSGWSHSRRSPAHSINGRRSTNSWLPDDDPAAVAAFLRD